MKTACKNNKNNKESPSKRRRKDTRFAWAKDNMQQQIAVPTEMVYINDSKLSPLFS
jgi:hypothetical protein